MAFRFAACNEIFGKQPLGVTCAELRAVGYQGLEIAPFTLADDPALLSFDERSEIRRFIAGANLQFVGLHWLLAAPPGLHATSRDENTRMRTWTYVKHFIDLCADIAESDDGHNGVVVFGSPKQRGSSDGLSKQEATSFFIDGLKGVARHAESHGVTLLVEALSPDQTDVVTSLEEAVSIVKQVDSPAIQTMFDVHNAVRETTPHVDLIRQFFPYIKHIHVNELDGREPGMGDYDFDSLMACLTELNYNGWVSLEAFDFTRDAKEIVSRSLQRLKAA